MATLKMKDINKVYPNGVQAVFDFSFVIRDKEFIVFVGPSGCGKSTTLRMVAGLEEITAGELYIDEVLVNDVAPKDRNIAMVFQSYALYPHMTVRQNIMFPLENIKVPKGEALQRAQEMADLVGIGELMDRKPKQLSGGQQQRVAIARAIVAKPNVILADEPTGNLDSVNGEEVMQLLQELSNEGTTIVMVTHSPYDANYAHRVINLFDGQIVTETVKEAFHV